MIIIFTVYLNYYLVLRFHSCNYINITTDSKSGLNWLYVYLVKTHSYTIKITAAHYSGSSGGKENT